MKLSRRPPTRPNTTRHYRIHLLDVSTLFSRKSRQFISTEFCFADANNMHRNPQSTRPQSKSKTKTHQSIKMRSSTSPNHRRQSINSEELNTKRKTNAIRKQQQMKTMTTTSASVTTNNNHLNLINISTLTMAVVVVVAAIIPIQVVRPSWAEPLAGPSQSGRAEAQTAARQAHFAEPDGDSNVQKVAVGRSTRFKCAVNDIGDHKVAWFHKDKRVLLAFDNKTVAWKDRIQVSSHANSVFFLQIDSVQLSDKGQFLCQLNTQPVQSQIHILDVVKSPQIREQETTVNIEPVKEFSSVELRCVADGIPKPVIKWRRESQMHELPSLEDEDFEQGNEVENDGGASGGGVVVVDEADDAGKTKADDVTLDELKSSPQMASKSSHQTLDSHIEAINDSNDDMITSEETITQLGTEAVERHPDVSDGEDFKSSLSRRRRQDDYFRHMSAYNGGSRSGANSYRRRRSTSTPTTSSPIEVDGPTSTSIATTTTTTTANSSSVKPFLAEGEVLRIDRVSRYDMGFYMCIASNGVPPSVSQRIFLPVSFVQRARVSTANSPSTIQRAGSDQTGRSYLDDDSLESTSRNKKPPPPRSAQGGLANDVSNVLAGSSSSSSSSSLESSRTTGLDQARQFKVRQETDLSPNSSWKKRINATKGNNNNSSSGSGNIHSNNTNNNYNNNNGISGGQQVGGRNNNHRYRQLKAARSSSSSSSSSAASSFFTSSTSTCLTSTITTVIFGSAGGGKLGDCGNHHFHHHLTTMTAGSSRMSPTSVLYFCATTIAYYCNYIICNYQLLLFEVLLLLLLKAGGFEWI